jgi:hypothetical protein
MAHAAEIYARRQHLSDQAIEYAHAVKIDAQTLLGEFLKTAPKNKGGQPSKRTGARKTPVPPTYTDVGIGKSEAKDARLLADLKQEDPDLHEAVRASKVTVTQTKRKAKEKQREQRRERNRELVADTPVITEPQATFATIVIDPPWDWGDDCPCMAPSAAARALRSGP